MSLLELFVSALSSIVVKLLDQQEPCPVCAKRPDQTTVVAANAVADELEKRKFGSN